MRALILPLIVLCLTASARAETYTLRDQSKLILVAPAGWTQSQADLGDLIFRFTPKNPKTNAAGELTVSAGVVDEYSTKDKLFRYVADMAREMAASLTPKPRVPDVKPFNCKQGFGFFFSLVDPSMVGKESEPGNFKQVTGGVIRLGPGVMVEVHIASDGDKTEGYQQLLAMVEGLELKR
jgi:hypothetical protein